MDVITAKSTNGFQFKISQQHADLLDHKWHVVEYRRHKRVYRYVVRPKRKGRGASMIFMHRVVLERMLRAPIPRGIIADHINGDTLDNRIENIRPVTPGQNRHNGHCDLNNTSGYRGVSLNRRRKEWCCTIMKEGKRYFVGWFKDKHEAAAAYNEKATELYGEFAKLNEIPCQT